MTLRHQAEAAPMPGLWEVTQSGPCWPVTVDICLSLPEDLGAGASRNCLAQLLLWVGFAVGNLLYHLGSSSLAAV